MVETERSIKTLRDIWKLILTSCIVQSMQQVVRWRNSSIMMRKYSCCSSVVCLSFTILNVFENKKGIIGLFQKKSTPSQRKACWKSHGRWVNSSGNPDERGALNLKIHPRGLLSILSIFQSLQSISFQKITEINYQEINCVFKFYYSFKLWARLCYFCS